MQRPTLKHTIAKTLRANATDCEKELWYYLRRRELGVKFRRQQPIGPYIVDFVCLESTLIIELDGGQHSANKEYDRVRDNFLLQEGYRVLRFWNNDWIENKESVLHSIHQALTPS